MWDKMIGWLFILMIIMDFGKLILKIFSKNVWMKEVRILLDK